MKLLVKDHNSLTWSLLAQRQAKPDLSQKPRSRNSPP